jgi:hypothetical protein
MSESAFDFEHDVFRAELGDLGIEIEIDLDGLRKTASGYSSKHAAVGVVRYPETATQPAETGLLLYLMEDTPNAPLKVATPGAHELLTRYGSDVDVGSYMRHAWSNPETPEEV